MQVLLISESFVLRGVRLRPRLQKGEKVYRLSKGEEIPRAFFSVKPTNLFDPQRVVTIGRFVRTRKIPKKRGKKIQVRFGRKFLHEKKSTYFFLVSSV